MAWRLAVLLLLSSLVALLFWFQHQLWLPTVNPPYDKLVHAVAYGSALLLAGWSLRPTFWRCLVLALLGMAVGAGQEWHQSWLPGRVASVEDWLADVAGLLVGLLLCWLLSCWQRRRPTPPAAS
ncbi:MAG: VanZ family protein [Vogesella sp.]|uniref:VanZ family protein n=1 Tax=Vogesella sp. TaxID=1904252 RepID=UPI00391C7E49